MRPPPILLLAALPVLVAGCRGCTEEAKPGPPMPRGMLVPQPSGARGAGEREQGSPPGRAGEGIDFEVHRAPIAPGVELHAAASGDTERNDVASVGGDAARARPDAVWLSLGAMTFFHDAFARAYQPGTFDLFVPRIVDGRALAAELRAVVDRMPTRARPEAARAGDEVIQFAEAHDRLWVLTL